MYAIVEIAGKQYRLESGRKLYLPLQKADIGADLTFDRVLLVGGDSTQVGAPTVAGASVAATVLGHVKSDKILVFKKKRRKRYRVLRGHRQDYTQVQIGAISVDDDQKKNEG